MIRDSTKRRRRRCFLSGGYLPPQPNDWFDGGMPNGFVSNITMPDEQNIETYEVTTSTFSDAAVENAGANARFILAPGNYVNVGQYKDFYAEVKDFIHIVGKEQAWVDGAPNPNGTYFHGITSWENGTIVLENLIFDGTSDDYDGQGGADYAVYLNKETNVQIKNCVFNGQYLHDISFKRAQSIGEVIGNVFRNSARHSVEIGQECNYFSDETQVENVYIVGNDFEGNLINCITIQSSKNVYIDNNRFHDAGRIVRTVTFNKTPEPDVKLLTPPMRTEFTNNEITGTNWSALWFAGRGRVDDTLYFKDNTGMTGADIIIDELHPDDAALFTAAGNEPDTLDGPSIDPTSDI